MSIKLSEPTNALINDLIIAPVIIGLMMPAKGRT